MFSRLSQGISNINHGGGRSKPTFALWYNLSDDLSPAAVSCIVYHPSVTKLFKELQNLPGLSDTRCSPMSFLAHHQFRHRSLIFLLSRFSAVSLTSRNHQRDETVQNFILEDV